MKKAEVFLEYQNLISDPPATPQQLYAQACSNDEPTLTSWHQTWVEQIRENKKRFGSFKKHDLKEIFGLYQYKPVIIAGAGPSLKGNAAELKNRRNIPLVSCLHNFHYFEDLGLAPEFYVTLDAGPVTVSEVSEGGTKTEEEYWEITKDRTLLAFIGSYPELLRKWKGKILFFNCPMPGGAQGKAISQAFDEIEKFHQFVSTGGNVLGACLYIAKAYMGAHAVIFTGADFCFSYDHKFHAWDSKYDKNIGHCIGLMDVYGIRRKTWQSYANFKSWFECAALKIPGLWINATEGGTLGAYPHGNLDCFKYMDLADVFKMLHMNDHIRGSVEQPTDENNVILF